VWGAKNCVFTFSSSLDHPETTQTPEIERIEAEGRAQRRLELGHRNDR
jgi:hypothetical protein